MKRILSGIQPSGQLHLGNYFGMMSRMIQYQEKNDLFCFIVNYHALTTISDRKTLEKNTLAAACDFLALGLDPDRATFWIQSDVPQVTELTWLLSNMTSVGFMERSTSYKDKLAMGVKANMGLFSYPILMAADILGLGGEVVPVGMDQKQHLEIARDIAIRFNNTFGDVFIVPEPEIRKDIQLVPGIDGRKMSKSYNNTIPIFAEESLLKKKIMSIVTDSTSIQEPKNKDTPLFQLYSLFLDSEGRKELADRYDTPGLRYGKIKVELFERVMEHFRSHRTKREELTRNLDAVFAVLKKGAEKAGSVAETYVNRAREAMGLFYAG